MRFALLLSVWPLLSPAREEAAFHIEHFRAGIDGSVPIVLERPVYLKYSAPYFKVNATVRCDTPKGEAWKVGFIQQVDGSKIRQVYRRAATSWELPRFPFYDRATTSSPPWYGTLHEIAPVPEGSARFQAVVSMDDNLTGSVTWAEPLPPRGRTRGGKPSLRRVIRDQRFTTWLVARREADARIVVLRKVTWRIELELTVDPDRPVGERVTIKEVPQSKPRVTAGEDESIPDEVLKGPGANEAQEFWWTPGLEGIGERTRLRD